MAARPPRQNSRFLPVLKVPMVSGIRQAEGKNRHQHERNSLRRRKKFLCSFRTESRAESSAQLTKGFRQTDGLGELRKIDDLHGNGEDCRYDDTQ